MLAVTVFSLGIFLLVVFYTGTTLKDTLGNTSSFNASEAAMDSLESTHTVGSMMDYVIAVLFFAFLIALVITSFLVNAHTIFFVIYVFGLAVTVILSGVLNLVWDEVIASPTLATALVAFPITNHLLSNMGIYVTIAGAVSMFALYMKNRGTGL